MVSTSAIAPPGVQPVHAVGDMVKEFDIAQCILATY